jgi:hypothetical protein
MVPQQVIKGEPCNCEYFEHFGETTRTKHEYRGVPSGKHRAQWVGPICDKCAQTCMKDFLVGVTIRG